MKQSILLSLCILVQAPIFGASDEDGAVSSTCRGLGTMVYNVAKFLGRNDFLYLASTDAAWRLGKKLELREHFTDRDSYYIRFGRGVGQTNISLCHTPLHEAVEQGNLECVKLLCAVGANVHKEIKTVQELGSEDIATEPHPVIFWSSLNPQDPETEIQEFKDKNHVGFSALKLAQHVRAHATDKFAEREEIERLLIAHVKNE